MSNRREIAYLLLRVTAGVLFLFFGAGKFLMGLGTFRGALVEDFAETPLPAALVQAFGAVLPFVEVLLGLLLVLGLATLVATVGAQALLVVLLFGTVLLGEPGSVANNMLFAAVTFGLTWLLEFNRYSIDRAVGLQRPRADYAPSDPFRERKAHWGERAARETRVERS